MIKPQISARILYVQIDNETKCWIRMSEDERRRAVLHNLFVWDGYPGSRFSNVFPIGSVEIVDI